MTIFKQKIIQINVNAFSVDIIQDTTINLPYVKEALILIAGPTVNIISSLVVLVLHYYLNLELLKHFAIQSLLIGIINLMPISSLDGGQLFSILLKKHVNDFKAQKISFVVSLMLILPMMAIGFHTLLKSNLNFSILILMLYLSSFLVAREPKFFRRK